MTEGQTDRQTDRQIDESDFTGRYTTNIERPICSTPKLSKYLTLSPIAYKVIQWVPINLPLRKFITYVLSFILGELTPLNLGSF